MGTELVWIEGRLERRVVGEGSKSEHTAVCLIAGGDVIKVRRKGGNPFRDPELEKLVGKCIKAVGTYAGNTFVLLNWET